MTDSSTGMGRKTKPFMNSFRAAAKVKVGPTQSSIYVSSPASIRPTLKTCVCKSKDTAEGCKYGFKCHFVHEWELGESVSLKYPCGKPYDRHRFADQMRFRSPPRTSYTGKFFVDASLAGPIIGNGDLKSNMIFQKTYVRPLIQKHESDPNLWFIELKGEFVLVDAASTMVIELIGRIGHQPKITRAPAPQPSTCKMKVVGMQQSMMRSSLSEIGEKDLYMVVYTDTIEYAYTVYHISMSGIGESSPPPNNISLLREPLLLLGLEFPIGMAFFSFGSRIYMIGSGTTYCRSVHVFDTVTSFFGTAAYDQQMRTGKCQPVVIQPLKPFNDRVFVFSKGTCGCDLEVFYPDRENNPWTFIGGPSWYTDSDRVHTHSTLSDGFLLLTTNKLLFKYNIPSNTWTLVDKSYTCFFPRPFVYAYEIEKWFSFLAPDDNSRGKLDGFLCSYYADGKGIHEVGKSPLLYLKHRPAPCQNRNLNSLLYLGNFCFCLVRSGLDRPIDDWDYKEPFANHHATVTLFSVDASANSILEERSSAYKVALHDDEDKCYGSVCACFVI